MMDQCSKYCGKPFQAQIGKFRFLNELIKLVSPKVVLAYHCLLFNRFNVHHILSRKKRTNLNIQFSMSLLCNVHFIVILPYGIT